VFVVALFLSVAPSAHAFGCGIAEHSRFTWPNGCGEQERGFCYDIPVPYYCYGGYGSCCGSGFATATSILDEQDCGSEGAMGHGAGNAPPFSNDFNFDAKLRFPDCRGEFVNPSQKLVAGNQGSGAHSGKSSAGGGI
jgi:hypothetical protein